MKKLAFVCALVALFSFVGTASAAAPYDTPYYEQSAVPTTAVVNVWTSAPIFGKLVAWSCESESNMNVSVGTVANEGLSLGVAKTIFASAQIVDGTEYATNLALPLYLYGDKLTVGAGLSENEGTNTGFKIKFLIERP